MEETYRSGPSAETEHVYFVYPVGQRQGLFVGSVAHEMWV